MFRKAAGLIVLLSLVLVMAACAPTATPTATPTKAPPAAPTKAAEPTKPPAATATVPAPTATKPAPSPTVAPTTLKFAFVESVCNAPVFFAMEKGYFKEQGINIELVRVQSTSTAFPGIGTGELDFTVTSLGPALMNAVERGVDLRILADGGRTQPNWEWVWIVLRKDLADSGRVKSAADLKGMKVGLTAKGSMSELTMGLMLEKDGLKPDDVEMVAVQTTEALTALANKSLAAAFMVEPMITQGVQAGLITRWKPSSSFFGGTTNQTVILAGKNLLQNKDLGQRFVTAYLKGARDYVKAFSSKATRAEGINIVTKYSTVKDSALYDQMEMPYFDPNGELDMRSLGMQYDFYVQQGMYTGKLKSTDVIDMSYATYAAQKLGRQ